MSSPLGSQQAFFNQIIVAEPAPGISSYFTTVPYGQQWEVETVFFSLTTNATAGNRQVYVVGYTPSGSTIAIAWSNILQAAGGYYEYSMSTAGFFGDTSLGSGFVIIGLPKFILPGGSTIYAKAIGMKPTDQLAELCISTRITYVYSY
jgi:hypothetical protein